MFLDVSIFITVCFVFGVFVFFVRVARVVFFAGAAAVCVDSHTR